MPEQNHITVFICKVLIVAAVVFLLGGCASAPRKTYTGEPLLENQIARISVEVKKTSFFENKPARIYITHIDQKALGDFWKGGQLS